MAHIKQVLQSKLALNWLVLFSIQIFNMILAFAYFPFLLAKLGVAYFGELATFIALCQILIILTDYGLNFYGQKMVAECNEDKVKLFDIFISVTAIRLTLSGLYFVAVAGALTAIKGWNNFDLKLYGACFIAVISNAIYFQWFMQGLQSFFKLAFIQVISRLLIFGLMLIFVKDSGDLYFAALLQASPLIVASALGAPDLFRLFSKINRVWPTAQNLRLHLSAGRATFASTVLNVLYTSAGTFIIGIFYSANSAGIYFLSEKIIRSVQALHAPLVHAGIARSTQLFLSDKSGFRSFGRIQTILIGAIFLAISMTIFLASDFIRDIFFRGETEEFGKMLALMAFIPAFGAMSGSIGYLILMPQGDIRYLVYAQSAAFVVFAALFVPIISRFDVIGIAALATIVEFTAFSTLIVLILIKSFSKRAIDL
ncbi:oligosaccharide flippase family protein [Sphingomonas sp. 35-24ZXX]|uniref:oligosaccharide flippase family protein n=1 Tax=Sphingomonas sp. 35-24ZXX TaxID=1545915 RepID=UPI00053C062D|nr:oligosaccharide flippase family protein [Sphingomonas sp. 35-24ZXX]